jgi:GDPmannose 4,6-dehydratase
MWMMLQQDQPEDYVLSTDESHSVREFVEKAFKVVGMTVKWSGTGPNEVGICQESGRIVVRVDASYYRPTEVDFLLGDSSKARRQLGWHNKVDFDTLIKEMVLADIERCKRNLG